MKIYHPGLVLKLMLFAFVLVGCGQSKQISPSNEENQIIKYKQSDKKYLYYLHGKIIEDLGAENAVSERFGRYRYAEILQRFKNEGFEVISEARERDTDVEEYSAKLVNEIKKQMNNGVSPENITVVGASKGSLIAMLTSTKLANKNIKFVIIASCNRRVQDNYELNLHGKILSIYEISDTVGGDTCEQIKRNSKGIAEYKEIEIETKLDHGFLYKPLKEWIEPTINWAKK